MKEGRKGTMPEYLYLAKHATTWKLIKGRARFDSKKEIRRFLLEKGGMPPFIIQEVFLGLWNIQSKGLKRKIKETELAFFCHQFALILEAGISPGVALELMIKQCKFKRLKRHLENVNRHVKAGSPLSEAIDKEQVFPLYLKSMVEIGETSGTLEHIFNKLALYFEEEVKKKQGIHKALWYPKIIMVTMTFSVGIIMLKVIPAFKDMFETMEIELPAITRGLIALSEVLKQQGVTILLVGLVIYLVVAVLKSTKKGKTLFDKLGLALPIVGKIKKKLLTAQFSDTMGLLHGSGIPLLQSMEMAEKVLSHSQTSKEIREAMVGLKQGNALHTVLAKSSIYPELFIGMLSIGEETGGLETILVNMGVYFNQEAQIMIDQMIRLIEPLLTVFMAVLVGALMLAVVMPTLTLSTGLL